MARARWLRRRPAGSRPDADAAGTAAASAAARAPAGGAGGAADRAGGNVDFAPPAGPGPWASMPPLHSLSGPATVLDLRFDLQLVSWANPTFGLDPLGHRRAGDAPSGTVLALGRPMAASGGVTSAAAADRRTESALDLALGEVARPAAAGPATPPPPPAETPAVSRPGGQTSAAPAGARATGARPEGTAGPPTPVAPAVSPARQRPADDSLIRSATRAEPPFRSTRPRYGSSEQRSTTTIAAGAAMAGRARSDAPSDLHLQSSPATEADVTRLASLDLVTRPMPGRPPADRTPPAGRVTDPPSALPAQAPVTAATTASASSGPSSAAVPPAPPPGGTTPGPRRGRISVGEPLMPEAGAPAGATMPALDLARPPAQPAKSGGSPPAAGPAPAPAPAPAGQSAPAPAGQSSPAPAPAPAPTSEAGPPAPGAAGRSGPAIPAQPAPGPAGGPETSAPLVSERVPPSGQTTAIPAGPSGGAVPAPDLLLASRPGDGRQSPATGSPSSASPPAVPTGVLTGSPAPSPAAPAAPSPAASEAGAAASPAPGADTTSGVGAASRSNYESDAPLVSAPSPSGAGDAGLVSPDPVTLDPGAADLALAAPRPPVRSDQAAPGPVATPPETVVPLVSATAPPGSTATPGPVAAARTIAASGPTAGRPGRAAEENLDRPGPGHAGERPGLAGTGLPLARSATAGTTAGAAGGTTSPPMPAASAGTSSPPTAESPAASAPVTAGRGALPAQDSALALRPATRVEPLVGQSPFIGLLAGTAAPYLEPGPTTYPTGPADDSTHMATTGRLTGAMPMSRRAAPARRAAVPGQGPVPGESATTSLGNLPRVPGVHRLSTGTGPGDTVRVRRGGQADAGARRAGARAFTRGGVVNLPTAVTARGSIAADALLAHELTHVAQQRVLGSRLPGEHTEAGRRLEAEASTAEREVRGGAPLQFVAGSPVADRIARGGPPPARAGVPAALQGLPRAPLAPGPGGPELPLAVPVPTGGLAGGSPAAFAGRGAGPYPAAAGSPLGYPAVAVPAPQPAGPPAPVTMSAGVQRASDDDGSADADGSGGPAGGVSALLPDGGAVQELVDQIYPAITARLRNELRRHRDRLGRINDPGL